MQVIIPRQYTTTVIANEQLTPKIFWLRLHRAEPIPYQPGQYASLLIDSSRRPLSFATPSGPTLEFVVDVSPAGIASRYVSALQEGDTVTLMAPYGRFVVDASTRPLVFVAAGAGIGPIRAQIQALVPHHVSSPLTLVFGNRTGEYMFFIDEFTALAAQQPMFTFIPACSADDPAWTGERGLITDVTARRVPHLADSDIYVCGGPATVTAVVAGLQTMNVPAEQIHTEKFI